MKFSLKKRLMSRSFGINSAAACPPGTRLKALVLNILGQNSPLYKVQEFYQKQDVELLFGPDVKPEQFNDDSLGRALDYLYEADPWKVYTPLALSTLNDHPLKQVDLDINVTD